MLEQYHIYTNLRSKKKIWSSESKLNIIIWTFLVTKIEFAFKNELDYQIKPLKPVFFFNNFMSEKNLQIPGYFISLY